MDTSRVLRPRGPLSLTIGYLSLGRLSVRRTTSPYTSGPTPCRTGVQCLNTPLRLVLVRTCICLPTEWIVSNRVVPRGPCLVILTTASLVSSSAGETLHLCVSLLCPAYNVPVMVRVRWLPTTLATRETCSYGTGRLPCGVAFLCSVQLNLLLVYLTPFRPRSLVCTAALSLTSNLMLSVVQPC